MRKDDRRISGDEGSDHTEQILSEQITKGEEKEMKLEENRTDI